MDDAAPREPGATTAQKKKPWRRVPLSLVVTLIGIALTAWLLPAITRQWDDRQKAHELKAALLAQMGAATARVLEYERGKVYGQWVAALQGNGSAGQRIPKALPDAEVKWSATAFEIESKLIAYFPKELVLRWRGYYELVSGIVQYLDRTHHHWEFDAQPDPDLVTQVARIPMAVPAYVGRGKLRTTEALMQSLAPLQKEVTGYLTGLAAGGKYTAGQIDAYARDASLIIDTYRGLEAALLGVEGLIARELVSAHLTGYSTTSRDLLHDLIP